MSRPRHLSRLMVSPSVHVVYLFNHHRLPLRVLLRAGLDSASPLSTSSKDAPSGTTSFRNTPVLPIVSLDRKSTRLNSSHGYISYAVFCLKKKKKKQIHLLTFSRRTV